MDTTPFVDEYFEDPGDSTYDWRGVYQRKEYLSDLLKVILIICLTITRKILNNNNNNNNF